MATIQFKRGSSKRWKELNPILAEGEPGFDITSGRFKIGDGITPWEELLFQDEQAVVSKRTRQEFPSYGKENTIYKDETAQQLYQWVGVTDPTGPYKIIGTEGVIDINLINGGNANGTT